MGNPPKKNSTNSKGKIYRSTGSHYRVRLEESGEMVDATMRGKIRMQGLKSTNPVCVGDDVMLEKEKEDWAIVELLPRRNFIPRRSVNLSSRLHVLCANVDQAVILFTIEHPVTTLGYLDRLLATCEAFDVPVVILFNKVDLLQEENALAKLDDLFELYSSIGYDCRKICANQTGFANEIIEILKDKVSFVAGRSGAGKSSLINLAEPSLGLKTGDVSEFWGRGKHTTTFAELHELPFGGAIIDMPGFREMEVYGLERNALDLCFPEMETISEHCRFADCLHLEEPGCAVVKAVEEGEIALSRYHAYMGMLEELERNEKEEFM